MKILHNTLFPLLGVIIFLALPAVDLFAQADGSIYEIPADDMPYATNLFEIGDVFPEEGGIITSNGNMVILAALKPSALWPEKGGEVELFLDGQAIPAEAVFETFGLLRYWWIKGKTEDLKNAGEHTITANAYGRGGGLLVTKTWTFYLYYDPIPPIIGDVWAIGPQGEIELYDEKVFTAPAEWTEIRAKICDPWSSRSYTCQDLSWKKPPEGVSQEEWNETQGTIAYYKYSVSGIDSSAVTLMVFERIYPMEPVEGEENVFRLKLDPQEFSKEFVSRAISMVIKAFDNTGHMRWKFLNIGFFNECPSISLISPEQGEKINFGEAKTRFIAEFEITDLYKDQAALEPGWLEVVLDGEALPPATALSQGKYLLSDHISDDISEHTFQVRVKDRAGSICEVTRTFVVDSHPPMIELVSPKNKSVHNQPIDDMVFRLSDDYGLESLYEASNIRIDGRGKHYEFNETNGELVFADLDLKEGEHQVQIGIQDKTGNTVMEIFTFYVDTTPPEIGLTYPKKGEAMAPGSIVQLEITDGISGVDQETIKLEMDGEVIGNGEMLGGDSNTKVRVLIPSAELGNGKHDLVVRASDLGGNDEAAEFALHISPDADGTIIIGEIKPKMIDPSAWEQASVSYLLPFQGRVKAYLLPYLRDEEDNRAYIGSAAAGGSFNVTMAPPDDRVITIDLGDDNQVGWNSFMWDGKNEKGEEVKANAYEVWIKMETEDGREAESIRSMNSADMEIISQESDEASMPRIIDIKYEVKEWGFLISQYAVVGSKFSAGEGIDSSDRIIQGPGRYDRTVFLRNSKGVAELADNSLEFFFGIDDIPATSIVVQYPRPLITNVRVSPERIWIDGDERIYLGFDLAAPAKVTAYVINDASRVSVQVFASYGELPAGSHEYNFIGQRPGSLQVTYRRPHVVMIRAEDSRGAVEKAAGVYTVVDFEPPKEEPDAGLEGVE